MLNKSTIYTAIAYVMMVLFCLYTYVSMRSLGFEEASGSFTSIVSLVVTFLGFVALLVSINEYKTQFVVLWLLWIGWMFMIFFLFGLGGKGIADIFRVWLAPMTFLLFYYAGRNSLKSEKVAFIGFTILFALAFYENISLFRFVNIVIGEEMGITNLVYWCLCAVPFLFLAPKNWQQLTFLIASLIIVLLAGKRSASIAIALISVVFLLYSTKSRKNKGRNLLFFVVAGIALYYVINRYFMGSLLGLTERMSNMGEDEGSGRIDIYKAVFAEMDYFSLLDWLVGRGFGSITITNHTNAHNDGLQMVFEYGLVGLIFYITMLFTVIKRTLRLRKIKSPYYMGYAASLIIFVVLGAVSNLVVFYSYFAFICAYWGFVEAKMVQANQIR